MKNINGLNEYQSLALKTLKIFDDKQKQLEYAIVSLSGEVGEMANLLKKKVYHNKKGITNKAFIDEASDVLWYLACVADALNTNLSNIATYNINKLNKRYKDGKYDERHYMVNDSIE
jgi:NTP pyrophosphatase (non-canonical NTP hydrolase)